VGVDCWKKIVDRKSIVKLFRLVFLFSLSLFLFHSSPFRFSCFRIYLFSSCFRPIVFSLFLLFVLRTFLLLCSISQSSNHLWHNFLSRFSAFSSLPPIFHLPPPPLSFSKFFLTFYSFFIPIFFLFNLLCCLSFYLQHSRICSLFSFIILLHLFLF
jgi:hypothetical protein